MKDLILLRIVQNLKKYWNNCQRKHYYARNIDYIDFVESINSIINIIENIKQPV